MSKLTSLDISENELKSLMEVQNGLPKANQLITLILNHNKLANLTDVNFNTQTNIQNLYLEHNNITTLFDNNFKDLVMNNGVLSLNNNNISHLVGKVFETLSDSVELKLENNTLDCCSSYVGIVSFKGSLDYVQCD
eukprot:Pgem_evm1s8219